MPGHLNWNTENHFHTQYTHLHKDRKWVFFFFSCSCPLASWAQLPASACVCLCVYQCVSAWLPAGASADPDSQISCTTGCATKQTHSFLLEEKRWLAHGSSRKLSQTWWFRGAGCHWATGLWLAFLLTAPPWGNFRQSDRDRPACQFTSCWYSQLKTHPTYHITS